MESAPPEVEDVAARAAPRAAIATTFVAVAGGDADGAGSAAERGASSPSSGAGEQRRFADAALRAVLAASPACAAVVVLATLGTALVFAPLAGRWGAACAALAVGASVGWAVLPQVQQRRPRDDGVALHRLLAAFAGTAMAAFAALPWLAAARDPWALLALSGAVACAGAASLAPLPRLAAIAVALPASPTLVALLLAPRASVPWPALLLAAAAVIAAAAWLARSRHRDWRSSTRAQIEQADRIRELQRARDLALRADQDKSRFLAIASHDLRQPVHALGLFAATLERRLKGSTEEPLVRNVMRAIDGLDRSFNAMLDISRLDAGSIEPNLQRFPLRDLFRRLHMQFAGHAELHGLGLRFTPGGKSLSSDPQLLERILGNLIGNAIKYTQDGGIVVVARSAGGFVNVEVWDTGPGIAASELPRIFDEFYQVGRGERDRAHGLGMGLAIVKRLARLLGHRLVVASRPGKGSMFRVGIAEGELPGIQDATAAADTVPMQALEPRMVLVIDDEEAIRAGLVELLEEWGFQAAAAATIEEAEAFAVRVGGGIDLVLSDLHLGGGADGIDAIAAVRRRCGHDVPAIVITGDTSTDELRRMTDSGHRVLFKPVQPRKLYEAVRAFGS